MPRRINLTIDGLRKKQAPKPVEPDPDVVWPTMLEDDAPSIRMFDFTFFRGDTRWNAETEAWETIPEWTGDLTEKGRYTFNQDLSWWSDRKKDDIDLVYLGNNFVLTTAQIEAEYGFEVDDRWNRMPLQIVTEREADNKRWTMFQGRLNVRLRLVKSADATQRKFDISPDLLEDGTKKGNWRFTDNASDESDEYRLRGVMAGASYGIDVREVGTKSMCHYIHQNEPGYGGLSYGVDWLEPEGLFICPFNTADTENYKVTREPDYDADAVSGLILKGVGKIPVEIYFVFRRWAYTTRDVILRHEEVSDDPFIMVISAAGSTDTELVTTWNNPEGCGFTCNNRAAYWGPTDPNAVLIDCAGSMASEGIYVDGCTGFCCPWSSGAHYEFNDGECQTILDYESDCPQDYRGCATGESPWIPPPCSDLAYTTYSYSYTRTYLIQDYTRYWGTIVLPLWWGPPILDFWPTRLSNTTETVNFYYKATPSDDEYISASFDLIGDESYEEAVQHFLDAGGDEDLVDEIVSGYNSLHYFAPDRWSKFKANWHVDPETITCKLYNRFCSTADGKPLFETDYEGDVAYRGQSRENTNIAAMENFRTYFRSPPTYPWWPWPVWDNPDFWSDYPAVVGHYNIYEYDSNSSYATYYEESALNGGPFQANGPYGVGLSPMKEGTLCAIIKIRSKAYFVWRKTDEEFTERYLQVSGAQPSPKPFVSFEGYQPNQFYGGSIHFRGEGRKNTHVLAPRTAECHTLDSMGLLYTYGIPYETFDEAGCTVTVPWLIPSVEGGTELESPVYPVISRETKAASNTVPAPPAYNMYVGIMKNRDNGGADLATETINILDKNRM